MFAFFRRRRRQRWLRNAALPDELWTALGSQVPIIARLNEADQARLKDLATVFIAEKQWDWVGPQPLTRPDQLRVAAQACLPILDLGLDWYNDWSSLILTPAEFTDPQPVADGLLMHENLDSLSGQVLELGPVVLSWTDILESGQGTGFNVIIHEMAHKLDGRSGTVDGCPPLPRGLDYGEWQRVFSAAFSEARRSARRQRSPAQARQQLDPYAATDPGEFFAVCSEAFFERPRWLQRRYPEVFRLLNAFYHPVG